MPIQAIGGFFFRSADPDALAAWYKQHLGMGGGCAAEGAGEADEWSWQTLGGPVVFAPFKADTDYFAADKTFMLNLRVTQIGALIESLRGAGIDVETRDEWDQPGMGRFARIHDPEGNPIELWEMPE
jgi:predicted enzyme related to lactoylglutathione lyase